MEKRFDEVDRLGVNTIRMLSLEMIQKANSGHPGLPLGAAPMAYVLWTRHLKLDPSTSLDWANRDRFILSAGHGSAMLYSLLHLAGYQVSQEELKAFRQWGSKTPGHPEYGQTDGVEATTGPLGQGIAMAVGMAMAEAHLGAEYDRPNFPVIDHYTYSLVGDGDLMEGISHEAASLAGHLKLGKLIVLYDSNGISLDGPTDEAFTENVGQRFQAYGWEYLKVEDGNDLEAIDAALRLAKQNTYKPTLIEVKTVIGYGSKDAGTNKVHGTPLSKEDLEYVKRKYAWTYRPFEVPNQVYDRFTEQIRVKGKKQRKNWDKMFAEYKKEYSELAKKFFDGFSHKVPSTLADILPYYPEKSSLATRAASAQAINALASKMPSLWGGAADLASSNKTMIKGGEDFQPDNYAGRNIWFGVREFGMACALNGILLHGGTRVFGGTFFVFSDYLKAAIRLSALQKLPVIYVLTHDSIAVGEDGPTHEPIEQLAGLRTIPNIQVLRPADGNETSAAWKVALETLDRPTVLILSRQALQTLPVPKNEVYQGVERGGYVVQKATKEVADGILLATGSEVELALKAQQKLLAKGQDVTVVSLPCLERFNAQSEAYRQSVLPKEVTYKVSLEAGATYGWAKYATETIGIDRFGTSAPGEVVAKKFNLTPESICDIYLANK